VARGTDRDHVAKGAGAAESVALVEGDRAVVVAARLKHQDLDAVLLRVCGDRLDQRPAEPAAARPRSDHHPVQLGQDPARRVGAAGPLRRADHRTRPVLRTHRREPGVPALGPGQQPVEVGLVLRRGDRRAEPQGLATGDRRGDQLGDLRDRRPVRAGHEGHPNRLSLNAPWHLTII
jgi:hypothetical protein